LPTLLESSLAAAEVARALALGPHPEGGHYRETWRDRPADGSRGAATAILFLLAAGEASRWHRVDADELWIWQAGAPLTLDVGPARRVLGPELGTGQVLQALVPRLVWQAAESLGAWTLVSCVVAPAFRFEGFEMAPAGWRPSNEWGG
jgi:hypothetical protein